MSSIATAPRRPVIGRLGQGWKDTFAVPTAGPTRHAPAPKPAAITSLGMGVRVNTAPIRSAFENKPAPLTPAPAVVGPAVPRSQFESDLEMCGRPPRPVGRQPSGRNAAPAAALSVLGSIHRPRGSDPRAPYAIQLDGPIGSVVGGLRRVQ
jgi:hypothetical protein